jgi:peptide/nickel transport system substrate-binding protein
MTYRAALSIVLLLLSASTAALAQSRRPDTGTLVIAVAREALAPIPTLWGGDTPNREVSDLLFLRLADLGPQVLTGDEKKFLPKLAQRWTRRDSLTLVFDLDPRARWHDGQPVVANDVVFALERARNPKTSGGNDLLLRRIASVTAESPSRVVVRYTQAYAEQLYDVVFHVPPLPSHLVGSIHPDSLAASPFAANPVGNGPYRFTRRVPGQRLELAAWPDFYLGSPRIERIVLQVAGNADARANMLRAGEVDAIDNVFTLPDPQQVKALPDYRYYPSPGPLLLYINFNQRSRADSTQPHAILTDPVVRKALVLAVDRERLAQATLGPFTHAPSAPVSALVSRAAEAPAAIPYNAAEAKRLLASRGWGDSNNDGVLDKNGVPLALNLMVPATSASRKLMAAQIQEAYRLLGITITIETIEPRAYVARRNAGEFDLEFWQASQDPTPTGLATSWSCTSARSYNVAHYCNPTVDSLVTRGTLSQTPVPQVWREAVRRISEDYPAIFIAAPVAMTAVHRRFEHVTLRPESLWSDIWKWSVKPGAQLERDRQ